MKPSLFAALVAGLALVLAGAIYGLSRANPLFDTMMLHGANVVLAAVTIIGYLMAARQMQARPQAFVTGVMSGTLLKMVVVAGSLVVYVLMQQGSVHTPSLFVVFGLYVVYTGLETALLQRLARTKP